MVEEEVALLKLVLDVAVDVQDVGNGSKDELHPLRVQNGPSWLLWPLYLLLEHLPWWWWK